MSDIIDDLRALQKHLDDNGLATPSDAISRALGTIHVLRSRVGDFVLYRQHVERGLDRFSVRLTELRVDQDEMRKIVTRHK